MADQVRLVEQEKFYEERMAKQKAADAAKEAKRAAEEKAELDSAKAREERAARFKAQMDKEAAEQRAQAQRSKRFEIFDKNMPCREDEYKCPRCFYRNCYPRDACNKLACAKCGQSFCVQCGKPASASCRCIVSGW